MPDLEGLGGVLEAQHADQADADGGVALHLGDQRLQHGHQRLEAVRPVQLHRDEVPPAVRPALGRICTRRHTPRQQSPPPVDLLWSAISITFAGVGRLWV